MSKLHIKKGDIVYVNAGEDKGKTGRVLEVNVEKQRAIVEGVNIVSKHTKPNAKNPQAESRKKKHLCIFLISIWLIQNQENRHALVENLIQKVN
jgi:ribosomal protein L24